MEEERSIRGEMIAQLEKVVAEQKAKLDQTSKQLEDSKLELIKYKSDLQVAEQERDDFNLQFIRLKEISYEQKSKLERAEKALSAKVNELKLEVETRENLTCELNELKTYIDLYKQKSDEKVRNYNDVVDKMF